MADDKYGKEVFKTEPEEVGNCEFNVAVYDNKGKLKVQLTRMQDDEFRKLGRLTLEEAELIYAQLGKAIEFMKGGKKKAAKAEKEAK